MPDKPEEKPTYRRVLWGRAHAEWMPTRDRLIWGVITAVVGFGIAYCAGRQMTPQQYPLLAGGIGAVGGVVLVALLYLLWHRLRAPARIWADDQITIEKLIQERDSLSERLLAQQGENARQMGHLQRQLEEQREFNYREALSARLELEIGEESRRTLEERLRLGEARLIALEKEIGSGDFSHAAEVLALRKILPSIFSAGVHGRTRQRIIERVHDLAEAVEIHFRRSEDPPPSTASEPDQQP